MPCHRTKDLTTILDETQPIRGVLKPLNEVKIIDHLTLLLIYNLYDQNSIKAPYRREVINYIQVNKLQLLCSVTRPSELGQK